MILSSCRIRRVRQALHIPITLFLLVVSLLVPIRAEAITWETDGVASVGAADCVIVADFRNPSSVSLGDAFRRDGNNLYAVYKAPNGGGAWEVDGSILLTYKKGLLDNEGAYHDLHVKISGVNGVWKKGLTTSPKRDTVRQRIAQLASGWIAVESGVSQITYNGATVTDGSSATGMNCGIYAWTDSAGAGLRYNLLVKDIDQPNRIAESDTFSGPWQERVALRSTELRGATVHVEKGTYLSYSSNIIVGTKDADSSFTGSIYTAAFAAPLTLTESELTGNPPKGFAIGWSGSQCQTRIFEDLSYAIVTKAGTGGICEQVAGTSAEEAPIALVQNRVTDGVFVTRTDLEAVPKNDYVVTVTPKAGYEIDQVTLDGNAVAVSSPTGMSVPITGIVSNHVVTATFRALPDTPEPDPEPEPGTLVLQKSTSQPDIAAGNPCYSLEGARYDVYADETCSALVTTLVTNADGASQRIELDPGAYYVRESVASPGYLLDETVYEASLSEGAECLLEVREEPVTAGLPLEICKTDADLGVREPQGSASLAGASFTVAYYGGLHASVDELPETPTRSWTLVTDDDGVARFDESHISAGEPFRDADGAACLPLGTLLVREVQPPHGYALPAQPIMLLAHLTQGDGTVQMEPLIGPSSMELEVSEPVLRGGLRLKKVDSDGQPLAGAVFAVINASDHQVVVDGTAYPPGEVCLTVESGTDGIASTPDNQLPFGSYEVREQQAPRGWQADASWKATFDIAEAAQVADLTQSPLVNKPLTVDVTLKAHKDFDGTSQERALEAGMFSFTLSDAAGKVIDTATNDADGEIAFKPLTFGYDDLDTDHIYRIAEVAGDDEEIVYDDHTEEVHVRITAGEDGRLSAEVQPDEDGVTFSNRTVERLALPVTGMAGIRTLGYAMLGAVALILFVGRRMRGLR